MAMERMTAWRSYARKKSYHAVTIVGQDHDGVLAMVSTAKSTVRMHQHLRELAEGDVSGMPSWTQFLVMHSRDVSMDSISPLDVPLDVLMDSIQQLHVLRQSAPTLEQYLDKKMGHVYWRGPYSRVRNQYFDNLRDIIFDELRIPEWLEITAGYSMEEYRSLDVQVQAWGGRDFEAWYLVNSAEAESERIVPEPAEWFNCRHVSASGWRPPYADFSYREVLPAKLRL